MIQSQNFQRHDVIILLVIPEVSPMPGDRFYLLTRSSDSQYLLDQVGSKEQLGKGASPCSAMEDVVHLLASPWL